MNGTEEYDALPEGRDWMESHVVYGASLLFVQKHNIFFLIRVKQGVVLLSLLRFFRVLNQTVVLSLMRLQLKYQTPARQLPRFCGFFGDTTLLSFARVSVEQL